MQAETAPVYLMRINGARNMRRFYRLDVRPDLFGGYFLLRHFGRIGTPGRVMAERFEAGASALEALETQAERKRRRGYR